MHCLQGEIAKVTLTNTVLEFPGPISISCEYGLQPCQELLVTYEIRYAFRSGLWPASLISTHNVTVFAPFVNIIGRYNPDRASKSGEIIAISRGVLGQTFCTSSIRETVILGYCCFDSTPFSSVTVLSVKIKATGIEAPKRLVIRDANGVELYSQLGDCFFSVECKAPCPEGTLDCGDCCLDCNSIFNSISAIRRILRTLG